MVDVKIIGPTDRVFDRKYLMIVYGDHGMIVDADKGATRIVALDRLSSSDLEPAAAILENAKRKAAIEGIPVVYVVDHSQLPRIGSPIPVPD